MVLGAKRCRKCCVSSFQVFAQLDQESLRVKSNLIARTRSLPLPVQYLSGADSGCLLFAVYCLLPLVLKAAAKSVDRRPPTADC